MAFTDKTWAFGEALESAEYNVVFRDNFRWVRQFTARTSADQSNSTTTFADLTGVNFPIGVSETWFVELHAVWHIGGAEDGKTTWNVPSGATGRHWLYSTPTIGTATAAIGADLVAGTSGTADYPTHFCAVIVNGANAGTPQFRFAQFSGGAEPSIMRANVVMIAHRIA